MLSQPGQIRGLVYLRRGHIWTSGMIITETDGGCQVCHLCALGYSGLVPEWMADRLNRRLLARLLGIKNFFRMFLTDSERAAAIQAVANFNSFYRSRPISQNATSISDCDPATVGEDEGIDAFFLDWAPKLRSKELDGHLA